MAAWLTDVLGTTLTAIAVALAAIYVTLYYLQGIKSHPQEPIILRSWIPFIGPIIGMIARGGRHVKLLGLKHHREPIFTLPVPGSRLYIVTDPTVAAYVQRATKTLSWTDIIPDSTVRILALDSDYQSIVRERMDEPGGYIYEVHKLYKLLEAGDYISEISTSTVHFFKDYLFTTTPANKTIDLQLWVQNLVGVSTAKTVLGPENPFVDRPELLNDFWDFDRGLGGLLMGIAPSVTARKAYFGREKVVKALEEYYQTGGHNNVTKLVKARYRLETQDFPLNSDSLARSVLSILFASLINTTSATTWMLLHLYADPSLLAQVRDEIEAALAASVTEHGPNHLRISHIVDDCPLLLAVFREIIRMNSENFGVRVVREDTVLNNEYFLKKGGVVQISGGALHSKEQLWGGDVNIFNPQRFLKKPTVAGKAQVGFKPAAFRGFGGGTTMCPGRHFATNEVLCLTAMVVRSFDMTTSDGKRVVVPQKNDAVLPIHVLEPKGEHWKNVRLTPRSEAKELGQYIIVM